MSTASRVRKVSAQDDQKAARQASKLSPLLDAPRPWAPWRDHDLNELDRHEFPSGITRVIANGWFAVLWRPVTVDAGYIEQAVHLMIRNAPNTPVRSWRDLQRIKDELVGPEWGAYEVFPPRREIVDQANMTHLWCMPPALLQPEFSLFAWNQRGRPAPDVALEADEGEADAE